MLGPLIDALTPYLPGWLELPEAHGAAWGFAKGRLHKYIKRVPKPGGGYRYYYNAAHGGTVAHSEHFVEGASFKDHEGHWHIKSKDGDTLHLRHDETGEERKMTHAQLAEHLGSLHGATIKHARESAAKALAEAREAGASKKQIARLEERALRVGVDVAKEAQRAAFESHRKATGEFHPWDPAERTPPKAKDPMQVAIDVAKMRAKWREGNEVHERNKRQPVEAEPVPTAPAFDYDQAMSERRERHDALATEHRRQRERHLAEADKALKSGDRQKYAGHARAAEAHMKAEAAQIASRDKAGKGRSDEAALQSRKANAASRVLTL